MTNIFPDLHRAIRESTNGIAHLIDPETNEQIVVMSAAAYQERVQQILDSDITPTAEIVDAVMRDDDANDPYLEQYQRFAANP